MSPIYQRTNTSGRIHFSRTFDTPPGPKIGRCETRKYFLVKDISFKLLKENNSGDEKDFIN